MKSMRKTATANIDLFVEPPPTTKPAQAPTTHKTTTISESSGAGVWKSGKRSSSLSSFDGLTDRRVLAHCRASGLGGSISGSSADWLMRLLVIGQIHDNSLNRNNKNKSKTKRKGKSKSERIDSDLNAEINIAHHWQQQNIDKFNTTNCCWCRRGSRRDGAKKDSQATDCCNHECRATNQFYTCYQALYPCLSHKHSLASVERRWRREITSTNGTTTINNAIDCVNRWQANDGSRSLDHNYDTKNKTLFPNKDAPQANTEEGDNNNTSDTSSSKSSICNNQNKNRSDTLTTDSDDNSSYASSPSPSPPSSSLPVGSGKNLNYLDLCPSSQSSVALSPSTTTNETSSIGHFLSHLSSIKLSHLNQEHSTEQTFALVDNQHQHQQQQSEQQVADCPSEVMEILRQHTLEDRLLTPKTYPNNTLIVDLKKCHHTITNIWPKTTQATAATLTNIKSCWPFLCTQPKVIKRKRIKRTKYNFFMPESLLRTNVKLKLDDYDKALSVLTSDVRYQLHLILYRRIQAIWFLMSTILSILVPVVLTNLEFLMIIGACCLWLGLQITGALVTSQFRKKLDEMLEKSVAQVNTFLMDHNLMLGVINVGGLLTKTKLMIPMLYFDTLQCREQIESIISIDSRQDADGNSSKHILDYSKIDLPLMKPNTMALAQSLAKKIVLRYSQRWISYFDKRKLMFTDDRIRPRHLSTGKCLCQFIEEQFRRIENYEEAKHNKEETTINSSSYSSTKLSLINGKQQYETQVKPQVIRNDVQTAPTIPTLSKLVSLKECREHLKIDMENSGRQVAQSNRQPQVRQSYGSPLNLWHQHLDDKDSTKVNFSPNCINQTPTSSPDISLEMGNDSIGRSDDLVRKLRLLLELRKNELQGIDGSLFSSVLYKAPHQSYSITSENCTDNIDTNMANSLTEEDNSPIKGNYSKNFYSQREGLFFLGTNGTKKSQQDTTRNQVLEIC